VKASPKGRQREFSRLLEQPLADNISVLLAAYQHILDLARDSSTVIWIRHGPGVASRRIRVPRFRLLLRYFVVDHVKRSLAELKRNLQAATALNGSDVSYQHEITRIESFEHSLPPIPARRLILSLVVFGAFFVSFLMAAPVQEFLSATVHHSESHKVTEPLGRLTQGIITFDRNTLVDGVKSFGCKDASDSSARDCSVGRGLTNGIAGIVLLSFALWILVFLPLTSFALKRMLFNAEPDHVKFLRDDFASEHDSTSTGLYHLEEAVFRLLNGPRLAATTHASGTASPFRPREAPLDLGGRGLLVIIPLVFGGVLLGSLGLEFDRDRDLDQVDEYVAFYLIGTLFVAFLFLLPIARFVTLFRNGRERRQMEQAPVVPVASLRRRFLAHLLDSIIIVVLSIILGLIVHFVLDTSAAIFVDWLILLPIAATLYLAGSYLRRPEERGRSLGKSALGIRVIGYRGDPVSFKRALFREAIMKWGFLGLPSAVAAGVPLFLNILWPCFDHRKRALHDLLSYTQVEQRETQPVAAASASRDSVASLSVLATRGRLQGPATGT
jgi:uncharacterized RDD family membrane protein YckC